MKLDLKEILLKFTKAQGMSYVNDYGSTLLSATSSSPWKCPETGIIAITSGTNGGSRAYWYVNDKTLGVQVLVATRLETTNYQIGGCFPVIKGHEYYSQSSAITSSSAHAQLFKLGQ